MLGYVRICLYVRMMKMTHLMKMVMFLLLLERAVLISLVKKGPSKRKLYLSNCG